MSSETSTEIPEAAAAPPPGGISGQVRCLCDSVATLINDMTTPVWLRSQEVENYLTSQLVSGDVYSSHQAGTPRCRGLR